MILDGILPPIPTPFDLAGNPDVTSLQSVIGQLEPDVDGFVVLGSNGEAAFLREPERSTILAAARTAIAPNKPMVVGTGGEATQTVIQRNREAAKHGADYVMVLPPFYFRSQMTQPVLEQHYRRVADTSPLPMLLYNVPAATTISLAAELIAGLAKHPNIVGLKDSSGNIGALAKIMDAVPDDFVVFSGNAPTLLAALTLGVRGGILAVANVTPLAYRRMLTAFHTGDIMEARRIQTRFNPIARAVTSQYGVPGLKAAMRIQGKSAGYPRAPLIDVSEAIEQELMEMLRTCD